MYDEVIARQVEQELCSLFGEQSYRLELKRCTGKYRGHIDYTLVFNSGRELYIGLDGRNYVNNLQDHLRAIRHFRGHQSENTKRINDVLEQHETPYCHAQVEVVPYDGTNHLTLYAAVILSTKGGVQFVYRTSQMHGCLVGYDAPYFDFNECMEHLLADSCGKMAYTHLLSDIAAA